MIDADYNVFPILASFLFRIANQRFLHFLFFYFSSNVHGFSTCFPFFVKVSTLFIIIFGTLMQTSIFIWFLLVRILLVNSKNRRSYQNRVLRIMNVRSVKITSVNVRIVSKLDILQWLLIPFVPNQAKSMIKHWQWYFHYRCSLKAKIPFIHNVKRWSIVHQERYATVARFSLIYPRYTHTDTQERMYLCLNIFARLAYAPVNFHEVVRTHTYYKWYSRSKFPWKAKMISSFLIPSSFPSIRICPHILDCFYFFFFVLQRTRPSRFSTCYNQCLL